MNINDTDGESKNEYEGDKLDKIFAAQKDLMLKYRPIAETHQSKIFKNDVKYSDGVWEGGEHNLHTREGNSVIKEMIQAAMQELAEAVQVMKNWKPWKITEVPTDIDHWKEEIVDSVHFLVEAMLLSGMTSEELYELYFKKHEINSFRINSNY